MHIVLYAHENNFLFYYNYKQFKFKFKKKNLMAIINTSILKYTIKPLIEYRFFQGNIIVMYL